MLKRNIIIVLTVSICLFILSILMSKVAIKEPYFHDSIDEEIKQLIIAALDYQYSKKNFDSASIFTPTYIEKNQSEDMKGLQKSFPYLIINTSQIYHIDNADNTVIKISVEIEDDAGTYHQIMTLKKQGIEYLVDDIQLDH